MRRDRIRNEHGIIAACSEQTRLSTVLTSFGPWKAHMTDPAPPTDALDGRQLREMFAAATEWLEAHAEEVNAVNVFPVPDGDTGTNMLLTMRSTMREASSCSDERAGAMLGAMSHGALMGARGNSGVILSQIISGLARRVGEAERLDAALLAGGFKGASDAAYRAVTSPTEGTVLTVIREVAEALSKNGTGDVAAVLSQAVETARESVERTPSLLPVLAEAGVVDAGGLGLLVLLEGMLRHLKGEGTDLARVVSSGTIEEEWLSATEDRHATEESPYGYCTEVLIGGGGLRLEEMRGEIESLGDSVIVVGDETLVRVHVHTDDPGGVLRLGTGAGELLQVKVDNIGKQAESFVERHGEETRAVQAEPPAGALSCVAVASGRGLAEVFRSVGGVTVVEGGPTMNPSASEILEAIEACTAEEVVVLPNDKNIILAAKQAAEMTEKRVHVLESRSVPQGIAAALANNPEDSFDENVAAMEEAVKSVVTIEVTRAVRATSINGMNVVEGQAIALVDDDLKVAAESIENAAIEALESAAGEGTSLVTLYYGADVDEEAANALADRLGERLPEHEVEVVFGGQPHYHYIISVE